MKDINPHPAFVKQPRPLSGDGPAVYEFTVAQSIADRCAVWFDGLDLARDDQGNTIIRGTIIDQAALHGVLARIRDLNLILLSVMRE